IRPYASSDLCWGRAIAGRLHAVLEQLDSGAAGRCRSPAILQGQGAKRGNLSDRTISRVRLLPPAGSPIAVLAVASNLLHLVGEPGNYLEQVAHNSVVRNLEDGSVLVLVDGNDRFRGAHPGKMLYGARDSHRNVQVGAHQPPRLTDLVGGRPPSVIGYGAGGSYCRVADGGGQVFHQLEVFR